MIYKTPLEAYNAWKQSIEVIAPDIVADVMKDTMQEAVRYSVYARYEPTEYIRREDDGGLSDKKNMIHDIEISNNKIIITLYNDTKGVESMDYIDDVIVTGTGYTWEDSVIYQAQPFPRDFYEETKKLLSTPECMNLIKERLINAGINIK